MSTIEGFEEAFVAATLDAGFRDIDVSRILFRVMVYGRGVKGMHWVLRTKLTVRGYIFATEFCRVCILSKEKGPN